MPDQASIKANEVSFTTGHASRQAVLSKSREQADQLLCRMITLQEELDWQAYGLYGLIDAVALGDLVMDNPPTIRLAHMIGEPVVQAPITTPLTLKINSSPNGVLHLPVQPSTPPTIQPTLQLSTQPALQLPTQPNPQDTKPQLIIRDNGNTLQLPVANSTAAEQATTTLVLPTIAAPTTLNLPITNQQPTLVLPQ